MLCQHEGVTQPDAPADHLAVTTIDGTVPTDLVLPPSGRGPGIVLVQEIFGVSPYIRRRAADLAALGFAVAVPNLYWRHAGEPGGDVVADDDPEALARGMALMQATDWDAAVRAVRASIAALRAHPASGGRAGVLGFCYGGGLAYAAAATGEGDERPDLVVAYYGSALPALVDALPVPQIPQLHHFGDADAYLSADAVRHIDEVVTTGPDTQVHLWPGAGHAFDNPLPMFHHEAASRGAWRVTTGWLAERLPVG